MKRELIMFEHEFTHQASVAISAAFGFLIALTWRDFISEVVNYFVGNINGIGSVYLYKFAAALIVTFVSVFAIVAISHRNKSEEQKEVEMKIKEVEKKQKERVKEKEIMSKAEEKIKKLRKK